MLLLVLSLPSKMKTTSPKAEFQGGRLAFRSMQSEALTSSRAVPHALSFKRDAIEISFPFQILLFRAQRIYQPQHVITAAAAQSANRL